VNLAGEPGKADAKPSKPRAKINTVALAKKLQAWHQFAALAAHIPELALDEDDSVLLASELVAAMDEFGVTINGRVAALLSLAGAVGIIYYPKAVLVQRRLEAMRGQSARVVNIKDAAATDGQ